MRKSTAAMSMERVRPERSAIRPARSAPRAEPTSAEDTVRPMAQLPAAKASSSALTVPLMTAVSKPKEAAPGPTAWDGLWRCVVALAATEG